MSTHEDWQAAKERRETFAIRAARALVDSNIIMARKWALEFDVADTDMHRIGQELDGGQ